MKEQNQKDNKINTNIENIYIKKFKLIKITEEKDSFNTLFLMPSRFNIDEIAQISMRMSIKRTKLKRIAKGK